jgi:hypothetical protein
MSLMSHASACAWGVHGSGLTGAHLAGATHLPCARFISPVAALRSLCQGGQLALHSAFRIPHSSADSAHRTQSLSTAGAGARRASRASASPGGGGQYNLQEQGQCCFCSLFLALSYTHDPVLVLGATRHWAGRHAYSSEQRAASSEQRLGVDGGWNPGA